MSEVTEKTCGGCRKTKELDAFYLTKKGTHGRDGYCKDCRKEANREYDKKWRERRNAYLKAWRASQVEKNS